MNQQCQTTDLGDGLVSVTFLRGTSAGEAGWWCIRRGRNFDYHDLSFYSAKDHPRWSFQASSLPTPKHAAAAVHLTFCDATGEGLACPKADRESVRVAGRMDGDGIVYVVTVKRSRTERVSLAAGGQ
ncbi:hypothetical protein [Rhodanobacter sp. OR92]|uniref:hypothetical protein n=1 Tax=Rhodanobacter sp. OR92 TaxID=1076524 RepID=UPI00040DC172|nr:hypothetical protein [Rhodanobacter sp. OR92]